MTLRGWGNHYCDRVPRQAQLRGLRRATVSVIQQHVGGFTGWWNTIHRTELQYGDASNRAIVARISEAEVLLAP